MCRPHPDSTIRKGSLSLKWLQSKLWPLPPSLVIALLPLLPTSLYLNRGYTVWFHLASLAYFFTRSPFLRKILILQGTGICLGWYSAIAFDYFVEGTFCHSLYLNMPGVMLPHMVQDYGEQAQLDADGSYIFLYTTSSYAMRALSHVLDTIGHPGLLYLFWRLHRSHLHQHQEEQEHAHWPMTRGVNSGISNMSMSETIKDVLTWPVIVTAWHFSRLWSLVHSYHNTGGESPSLWYFGHDVYILNNLNPYMIAYVAEGALFVVGISCRLYWDRVDRDDQDNEQSLSPTVKSNMEESYYESISGRKGDANKPTLIHSESAFSASSIMR